MVLSLLVSFDLTAQTSQLSAASVSEVEVVGRCDGNDGHCDVGAAMVLPRPASGGAVGAASLPFLVWLRCVVLHTDPPDAEAFAGAP